MTEEITTLEWALGGAGVVALGAYGYLMGTLNKLGDNISNTEAELAAHKTLVAKEYLPRVEFNDGMAIIREDIKRVEKRTEDGNKANLDSNERIRGEMSQGYNTLATMISNSNKISAEGNVNTAAIIAAVNAKQPQ